MIKDFANKLWNERHKKEESEEDQRKAGGWPGVVRICKKGNGMVKRSGTF